MTKELVLEGATTEDRNDWRVGVVSEKIDTDTEGAGDLVTTEIRAGRVGGIRSRIQEPPSA